MKKRSPRSIIILIITIIVIAMVAVGAARENTALAVSGFGLCFAAIIIGSLVGSVVEIKKRFPLRDDPTQKKIRAARYLSAAASFVITVGIIMMFVGIVMDAHGNTQFFMHLSWMLLAVGVAMAVTGSVLSAVMSHKLSGEQTVTNAVIPPSVPAANIPYSPDPVISRILANPHVLLDERIRQLHEVQNLLQYPEIQQIFFEPTRLYSLFTNDRVGELLNIVRDWITHNNADGIFAAAEQHRPAVSPTVTVQTDKSLQKPAPAKANTALTVFIVLFVSVFIFIIAVTLFGVIFGSHG